MKQNPKGKKMKPKGSGASDDMQQILQDSRFAHVPFDPKLRHLPKKARKVNIDSRFSSMFTDEKFHEKSTMDPRGRKVNFSTKEDLRKFYHLSSDEEDSEDNEKEESDENEDTDEEEDGNEVSHKKQNKKEIKSVKSKAGASQNKEEKEEKDKNIEKLLQDVTQDYARGVMTFSDDSSDDDSSTDEEEEEAEFEWGELDQDAVWDNEQDFEETSRIAVCNLDWDHIKAVDIMVVFNSFCPRGGSVKKVTIYPSEFGKQRMAEEDQFGPTELTAKKCDRADDDVDLDKLERGKLDYGSSSKNDSEALRRYERNRLRYYYAVVECDSVETSMTIYKDCDRQSFERAGVLMDLRYIPDDMTFDEVPHDVCEAIPEFYEPKLFVTTALIDTRPTLTWDQTDPNRQKLLSDVMKNAASGKDVNDEYLKNFIASSSESEDDLQDEEGDYSSEEDEDAKTSRIAKFRALIQEIDAKEKRKSDPFGLDQLSGNEENGGISSDEEDGKSDLTPFEKYLEKRKAKRRERMKKKKMENEGRESGDENEKAEISDDEIPDGVYDDPFFAQEMESQSKIAGKDKKTKKKKKKDRLLNEEANEINQGDLELLLMEEDKEEKKHFSMREIIDEHKGKSKKKLKKKAKLQMEEKLKAKNAAVDDFKINTSDTRFTNLLKSDDYNIDPSHPQFKRTKAMDVLITDVQKKRRVDSFEDMPDAKRINEGKGREEHELSMLVKRVKSKAKNKKS